MQCNFLLLKLIIIPQLNFKKNYLFFNSFNEIFFSFFSFLFVYRFFFLSYCLKKKRLANGEYISQINTDDLYTRMIHEVINLFSRLESVDFQEHTSFDLPR